MPSLSDHDSNEIVKLLLIGDAKSGKTGSLVSLVKAGYKLRILDTDNLLDVLKQYIMKECPDKINNVDYVTVRDKRKAGALGPVIDGKPKAFIRATELLNRWKYKNGDGTETDLGEPAEWGPDCILVIDSLSRLCDACYDFHDAINTNPDGRSTYGDAQDGIEALLAMLTSDGFYTNVIVIAHIQYMEMDDGKRKGFPQGVGQKLSPKIPQYFPSVVLYQNKGGKRTLQTASTSFFDLANPAPFAMENSYDIADGLVKFFGVLRGQAAVDEPSQAKPAPETKPKLMRKI